MFLAVLALICEAFATNFEAVGAMYLIILAFFSIMMICIRRVSWCGGVLTLLQWVIAIANVIFALTCPGNWTRNSQQVLVWMKDFVSMTPVDKLVLGVNTTVLQLISTNLLFTIFTIVLIGYAYLQGGRQHPMMLELASLPVASVLTVRLAPILFPMLSPLIKNFATTTRLNSVNFYSPSSYGLFIWSMLIITSSVIVIIAQSRTLIEGGLLASTLGAGIVSRVLMGFSPTIFASGARTFIFLDFALIYCVLKMIRMLDVVESDSRYRVYGQYSLAAVTLVVVLGNILSIGIV